MHYFIVTKKCNALQKVTHYKLLLPTLCMYVRVVLIFSLQKYQSPTLPFLSTSKVNNMSKKFSKLVNI